MKVVLNSAGLSEVLTSAKVRSVVRDAGAAVIARANYPEPHSDGPIDVEMNDYVAQGGRLVGRRAAVSVIAAHPAALPMEAKHGVLVKAAAAAGLNVTARRP